MKVKSRPKKTITFRIDEGLLEDLQHLRVTPLGTVSLNQIVEAVLRKGIARLRRREGGSR